MLRSMLAGLAITALCGPAGACDFSAADLRSVFDRTIAPKADLHPADEYHCSGAGRAAVCDIYTGDGLTLRAEDASTAGRASVVVVSTDHALPSAKFEAMDHALALLCSPRMDAFTRDGMLAQIERTGRDGSLKEPRVIIGDVSYRIYASGGALRGLRIKDRRLPNAEGVNTSDDE